MTAPDREHVVFWRRLNPGTSWGGGERRLMAYFRNIDHSRHRVTLLANVDVFSDALAREGIPVAVVPFHRVEGRRRLARFRSVRGTFRSLRPDRIVCIQGGFEDFDAVDLAAIRAATRAPVFEMHISSPQPRRPAAGLARVPGLRWLWYASEWRILLRDAMPRSIIVVSHEARRRLVDDFGAPADRVRVVHHGIDASRFTPDDGVRRATREQLGIPAHATIVISTARFSEEKKVDRVVDAYLAVCAQYPDAWLLLAGDGPLQRDMEARVSASTCGARVRFLGHVADVAPYVRASDVFVLSSDTEGLSNAMLEAMAAGLVAVVTDVPGSADAIEPGKNGMIVERSTEAVTQGLRWALDLTPDHRSAVSSSASATVSAAFDIRNGVRAALRELGLAQASTWRA